jgi:hypothetical protein
MASAGTDANTISVANPSEKVAAPAAPSNPFENCSAKLAGIAGAALAAEKSKPKITVEVRPFTRESLEKINLRTSNLIRDYGFLPKRSPHLQVRLPYWSLRFKSTEWVFYMYLASFYFEFWVKILSY